MFSVGSLTFVNFVAFPQDSRVYAGYFAMFSWIEGAQIEDNRSPSGVPSKENRLARKLRPVPGQMIKSRRLVNVVQEMILGQSIPSAEVPRCDPLLRGFPFFDFFREIFHNQISTSCRPLRGGKEGSACRAM
jgi:hypothetical protein